MLTKPDSTCAVGLRTARGVTAGARERQQRRERERESKAARGIGVWRGADDDEEEGWAGCGVWREIVIKKESLAK